MIRQKRRLATNARPAAKLVTELRQPLAAASNYVGAALLLLGSLGEQPMEAVDCLKKAGQEILRAGGILGDLGQQISGNDVEDSSES